MFNLLKTYIILYSHVKISMVS